MGNHNRIEHSVKELGGKLKKNVGSAIGDDVMEAEGRQQELEHGTKKEIAKAAENVKGKAQEFAGKTKAGIGEVIDDDGKVIRGKTDEYAGKARQAFNKPS